MKRLSKNLKSKSKKKKGFTLIELMVSMAIFMLISGVALRLFAFQQNSASILKDQVALNLSLRNAVTQLQLDISNAGSGYFQGVNIPSWPMGVSIINNVVSSGSSCYDSTTGNYGVNCFDQINVISAADPTKYPPVNISDINAGTGCIDTHAVVSGSNAVAYAVPTTASGLTLANAAKLFKQGDQVLLLNSSGKRLTTVVLTADASVEPSVGKTILFTFNPTKEDTITPSSGPSVVVDGYNTTANDPLNITTCFGNDPCSLANGSTTDKLTNQFCGGDWMIKLAPISYVVCAGPGSPSPCDTTSSSPDISDPKLERVSNGVATPIMDQVIGFRVAASIYNAAADDSTTYQYNSACYTASPPALVTGANNVPTTPTCSQDAAYNFSLVRSIKISVISRTAPNLNANYTYRNTFDGGPYQVEGTSTVVDPRNMSMND